jgi:monofunctional chorismate mutase
MDDLQKLREKINEVDDQILKALSERAKICKAIGDIKKQQGLSVRDISRENEVYQRVKEKSAKFSLDPAQIEAVYREIVNMCSDVQK